MSEPTPPGSSEPPVPSAPSYQPPTAPAAPPSAPSAPPSAPPSASGGYSAPPVSGNVAPAGFGSNDDKTWALVAHFGGAAGAFLGAGAGGWVAPLIALLVQGPKSPVARAHAVDALNFQIGISLVSIVCWILSCLVVPILIALAATIVGVVFGVIAGIKANEGTSYTYPMTFLKLVK